MTQATTINIHEVTDAVYYERGDTRWITFSHNGTQYSIFLEKPLKKDCNW